ncbi:MAG: glycosyltransferase family 4 protein [Pirellulales bacterium]
MSLSICLFTDVCLPTLGGAQTVLDQLCRQLVRFGHRPVVVAPPARDPFDDRQFGYPVIRHRRQWSKRFAVRTVLPRLLALHARHRFDVVHCHAAYPQAYVALTMRQLTGIPYVVRPHGADVLPDDAIRRVPRLAHRMTRALTAADAVVAQGESLRDVICGIGVAAERIVTINNGVNVAAFATAEPFPHLRRYILGLGSLVRHKGFDLLVDAYAQLRDPAVDLLIAGDGSESAALASQIARLGLHDRVQLLGPVTGDRKVSLYRSAAFFVCPSRREPFANVILEALASGLPVVATDVGGNRELVQPEVNGLLCQPESPAALATAMQRLLDEPSFVARLRADAAASIADHDWSQVAERYVDVYRRTVGSTRSSRA